MKKHGACPKCHSKDLIFVPGKKQNYGGINFLTWGGFRQIYVDRYVCGQCRFIEFYVDNQIGIEQLRKKHG